MIELNIPGYGVLQIEHLVCDVNGTLTLDGHLIDGVKRSIAALRDRLNIHIVTANTFGRQDIIDSQLNLKSMRLQPGDEAGQKAEFIQALGPSNTAAIGQGANDAAMLKKAALGICVLSPEGTAIETLLAADISVPDVMTALGLLENPLRIVATLRK